MKVMDLDTDPKTSMKETQAMMIFVFSQIGADVPAETFELSPVDRIFVRMGAKDHIMAGQSTFLTELSETAVMLVSNFHTVCQLDYMKLLLRLI